MSKTSEQLEKEYQTILRHAASHAHQAAQLTAFTDDRGAETNRNRAILSFNKNIDAAAYKYKQWIESQKK